MLRFNSLQPKRVFPESVSVAGLRSKLNHGGQLSCKVHVRAQRAVVGGCQLLKCTRAQSLQNPQSSLTVPFGQTKRQVTGTIQSAGIIRTASLPVEHVVNALNEHFRDGRFLLYSQGFAEPSRSVREIQR